MPDPLDELIRQLEIAKAGIETMAARLIALEQENKRLREALEPFESFAEFLEYETEGVADTDRVRLFFEESDFLLDTIFIGAFRAARSALTHEDKP